MKMKDQFVFIKKRADGKLLFAFSDSEDVMRAVFNREHPFVQAGECYCLLKAGHNDLLHAFDFPPTPELILEERGLPREKG